MKNLIVAMAMGLAVSAFAADAVKKPPAPPAVKEGQAKEKAAKKKAEKKTEKKEAKKAQEKKQ